MAYQSSGHPPPPWQSPNQWAPGPAQGPQSAPFGWPHAQQQPGPPAPGVPPHMQPSPPPPRRSPLTFVLVGLVAVCLLAVAGIVAVMVLKPGSDGGEVAGGYQNEDYSPPPVDQNPDPIPRPTTREEALEFVQRNALYGQSIPNPIRCDVPDIDVPAGSDERLQVWLNELTGCLMRMWDPPIRGAGYTLPRPSVTVYAQPITTKCGRSETRNAFYCSLDQQLYFASDLLSILPRDVHNRIVYHTVLAHEFGHHISGRIGISASMRYLAAKEATERGQKLWVRRNEAQADCFTGLFLRSSSRGLRFTDQDREDVMKIMHALGADTVNGDPDVWSTHPHAATRQKWVRNGNDTNQVSVCNTYSAPESEVR